jgi:hypothetical protein
MIGNYYEISMDNALEVRFSRPSKFPFDIKGIRKFQAFQYITLVINPLIPAVSIYWVYGTFMTLLPAHRFLWKDHVPPN